MEKKVALKKRQNAGDQLTMALNYILSHNPIGPIGDTASMIRNMDKTQLARFAEMEIELRKKEFEIGQQRILNAVNIFKQSK